MSAVVRIGALGRAEGILLLRNALMVATALLLPVISIFGLQSSPELQAVIGAGSGAAVITAVTVVTLVLFVYYQLTTALVARREELVLKRLRTGELADWEILAGAAMPSVVIAWTQILLATAVSAIWLTLDAPVNLLLVLVAILFGTLVFVLLAAASTAFAPTVDVAQVVTAPVMFVALMFSGLYLPLSGPLETVSRLLPLTPVVDLLRLGLSGTTRDGATVGLADSFAYAVPAVLVLLGWVVVGALATRRWFRWEPRR
ncbi:ABC transporter permease [Kribbella sp. NPDC051770]|uniref:ABC transporter permease n=1 Tax=Kribbella sp. NPDC051770 TaxID=3155413 RepID=UPI003445E4BB